MCWRAYTRVAQKPLQINLGAPLRAVWRQLVLEEENLPPHHSWQPYVRMGEMVVRVSILSWG